LSRISFRAFSILACRSLVEIGETTFVIDRKRRIGSGWVDWGNSANASGVPPLSKENPAAAAEKRRKSLLSVHMFWESFGWNELRR
jgi:hypothetical protein